MGSYHLSVDDSVSNHTGYSTVTVYVYAHRDSGGGYYGYSSGDPLTISCDGQSETFDVGPYDFRSDADMYLGEASFNISSESSRTVYYSASWYANNSEGYVFDRDSGSSTITADGDGSCTINPTPTTRTLTLTAGDYITSVSGGGTKSYNASVTASCVLPANTGQYTYTFDGWYEGSTRVSTSQSYTFNITYNRSLTAKAIRTVNKCKLKLQCGMGVTSVTLDGTSGTEVEKEFDYGTIVVISATVNTDDYIWSQWSNGDVLQSTSVALTDSLKLVASGAHIPPIITLNNNRRVADTSSPEDPTKVPDVDPQGPYAYINLTIERGSSDIQKIEIDKEVTTEDRYKHEEGSNVYEWWFKQDLTVSYTYTVTATDKIGSAAKGIYIPTAIMPISLYDDAQGNVGVGFGVFGTPGYMNTFPNMKLSVSNGSETKEATLYEILEKLGF